MQLTFQSIKLDNIHLLQAKQLIKPNFPYVCCFSSLLCVIFIPHTLKFPWKSLYEKMLSKVFESKHLIQFMLWNVYQRIWTSKKSSLSVRFHSMWLEGFLVILILVISDQLLFLCRKITISVPAKLCLRSKKKILRSQESTCVFSIKYLM